MKPSPSILPTLLCLALVNLAATTRLSAQTPHTRKPGSPERQAICDAMRTLVQAEYAEKKLPKPVVFKIDTLRVPGDFAYLECLPLFSDGTDAVPQYGLSVPRVLRGVESSTVVFTQSSCPSSPRDASRPRTQMT